MVDAAKERFVFSENALKPFIGRGRFERKIIVQKKGLSGTQFYSSTRKLLGWCGRDPPILRDGRFRER